MKAHSTRKDILTFIKNTKVVTTTEVAEHYKISWNTAEKYLLELVIENKILRLKKSGVNLWVIK